MNSFAFLITLDILQDPSPANFNLMPSSLSNFEIACALCHLEDNDGFRALFIAPTAVSKFVKWRLLNGKCYVFACSIVQQRSI